MSDNELLEQIRILAESIKQNSDNLAAVYKAVSRIMNLCKQLDNKTLAQEIEKETLAIGSSTDKTVIEAIANRIIELTLVVMPKETEQNSCIQPESIIKTPRYLDYCKKYESQANIDAVEIRIQTFPCTKHLHERVVSGKWKGYWHARLTGNLRIMYHYYEESRELVYEAIITKNDFDKG